ncbi:hypothetical protein ZWY2020_047494 [Hordeum vulgare]|nr:hypothetical protein ZWY2020_047494 [Hordeum vulgare]
MPPETRSRRAREAPPPAQRPRLTRAGSRVDAPTRGRSGQVSEDVKTTFQNPASSVQNNVMQLKAVTGEDEGGTPIRDLVAVVQPVTRDACASETALPSLQRTRLTRARSRGQAPASGRSGKVNEDVETRFQHLASSVQNGVMQLNGAMEASLDYMYGKDYAAASSSRILNTSDEAVEPSSRHDGHNTLGTYKDGQDNCTSTGKKPKWDKQGTEFTAAGDYPVMVSETRSRRAHASETALPSPQRPQLTHAGSRGNAPTSGRSGQVNEDVESRFQHLASSVQNDVMQLKATTREDEGGTHTQDVVAVVPRMTRKRAREACASETALPSLQHTRLTHNGSKGEAPTSGCSDMSGNDSDAASSSRTISAGDEAVEPSPRHGDPDALGTFMDGQDDYTSTVHDESRCKYDEETKTWVLDEKTMKVKELLRQYHVESQSSQESESSARWDDPLNRCRHLTEETLFTLLAMVKGQTARC